MPIQPVPVLSAVALVTLPALAFGQVPCQQQQLFASDPDDDDRFGQAVAIDGDVALVGAFKHDDNGINSGSVYVYRYVGATWIEEQELLPADGASSDRFGWSVALHGDVAAIGAIDDDDGAPNAGSVYVFRYDGSTWNEEVELLAPDAGADDDFGMSVAVAFNLVLVGAPGDDDFGTGAGAAYAFRHDGSTWGFEAKLFAADADPGDDFGVSVATSPDDFHAIIGASLDGQAGTSAGAAYVFEGVHGAWLQVVKLIPADADANDRVGFATAIQDGVAVVGAFNKETATTGAAYVFRRAGTTWSQEQKLVAFDAAVVDAFGWSVAIDGETLVVGARLEDAGGADSGSAYVYRFDGSTWGAEEKLIGADSLAEDSFAYSLDLSGDRVLVGAWGDDHGGLDEAGSAYVFLGARGDDCDGDDVADACEILAGAPDLDGDGLPDECEVGLFYCAGTDTDCPCANGGASNTGCDNAQSTGGVNVDAAGEPALNTAVLLGMGFPSGTNPTVVAIRSPNAESPPAVFGDGLRCLDVVGLIRIGATSAAAGASTHAVNHGAGPGTFHYQLWYRNNPATFCDAAAAFNLSNGLTIAWP